MCSKADLSSIKAFFSHPSASAPTQAFSPEEPVELCLSAPFELEPLLTLKGLFMEEEKIDLSCSSNGNFSFSHPIPLPSQPGKYCLHLVLEVEKQKEERFLTCVRANLEDWMDFYLKAHRFSSLLLWDEMRVWQKAYFHRKLAGYQKKLLPGERPLALWKLSNKKDLLFTTDRLIWQKEEVFWDRCSAHWKEGTKKLVIESLPGLGKPFLTLSLALEERDFLSSLFQALVELSPSIRQIKKRPIKPFEPASIQEICNYRQSCSSIFRAISILLLLLSLAIFWNLQSSAHFYLQWWSLVGLFVGYGLWNLWRIRPRGIGMERARPALLGSYTPRDLEKLVEDIQFEYNFRHLPALFIFPSLEPSMAIYFLPLPGRLGRPALYLSSQLLYSLDSDELRAVIALEMRKIERPLLPGFSLFRFSCFIFLFTLCFWVPFPLWPLVGLLGLFWSQTLLNHSQKKFLHDRELLLIEESADQAPLLLSAWLKMASRSEICARLEKVGANIVKNTYPTLSKKIHGEFLEKIFQNLPQGFLSVDEGVRILQKAIQSTFPPPWNNQSWSIHFDSLRLNWRQISGLTRKDPLSLEDLGPFLEDLAQNPRPLFPLVHSGSSQPSLEEKILFLKFLVDSSPEALYISPA